MVNSRPVDPAAIRQAAAFVEALNALCQKFNASLWPHDEDGPASLPFALNDSEGFAESTWRAEPMNPQSDLFGLTVTS